MDFVCCSTLMLINKPWKPTLPIKFDILTTVYKCFSLQSEYHSLTPLYLSQNNNIYKREEKEFTKETKTLKGAGLSIKYNKCDLTSTSPPETNS